MIVAVLNHTTEFPSINAESTLAKTQSSRKEKSLLKSIFIFPCLRVRVFANIFLSAWKPVSRLLFAAALLPAHAVAEDTLTAVLQQLRVQETLHFSYRETRTLQLLAAPWQATGDLYTSPRQMVIAQQSPTPVLTVISAGRMLHIDSAQDLQRSLKLEQPFAVPGMEPFMQLLYGTGVQTELEQQYTLSFDTAAQRWLLQLVPQQHAQHGIIRMQLSGASGHIPDRLLLEQVDGDHTEWQLSLLSQGAAADRELQQALDLLLDH
jgi:hypothetical protein